MLIYQHIWPFGRIQTCQTVGKPYSDTSPYGECSLPWAFIQVHTSCTMWLLLSTVFGLRSFMFYLGK